MPHDPLLVLTPQAGPEDTVSLGGELFVQNKAKQNKIEKLKKQVPRWPHVYPGIWRRAGKGPQNQSLRNVSHFIQM